jgi:tRNA(fMet)-specific endonuclease VapC
MRYLLDTDHVSLLERGDWLVSQRFQQVSQETVATSVITLEEQIQGWFNEIRKASAGAQPRRLKIAYRSLSRTIQYLSQFQHFDFDEAAYDRWRTLRQQGVRIGTQDLRIAAIALNHSCILVTRNQQDFAQVPDLQIENWSI